MTSMKTQRELLVDHLKKVGNISDLEARNIYMIRALPRRISDLEELGYVISRENKKDNTGRRYVRYHLISMDEQYKVSPKQGSMGAQFAMELAA